MFKSFLNYFES